MKRIRALSLGFAPGAELRRVRPGTILEVPDDFKGSWFEVLSQDAPPAKREAKKAEPSTLSEIAKAPVKSGSDLA